MAKKTPNDAWYRKHLPESMLVDDAAYLARLEKATSKLYDLLLAKFPDVIDAALAPKSEEDARLLVGEARNWCEQVYRQYLIVQSKVLDNVRAQRKHGFDEPKIFGKLDMRFERLDDEVQLFRSLATTPNKTTNAMSLLYCFDSAKAKRGEMLRVSVRAAHIQVLRKVGKALRFVNDAIESYKDTLLPHFEVSDSDAVRIRYFGIVRVRQLTPSFANVLRDLASKKAFSEFDSKTRPALVKRLPEIAAFLIPKPKPKGWAKFGIAWYHAPKLKGRVVVVPQL